MSKPTKPGKVPAVNIKKSAYAMATTDGQSAEVTMYGDIYDQQPTDWWGDPVEGQFILLDEFMSDLERIAGCSEITIRMNSYAWLCPGALLSCAPAIPSRSIRPAL